MRKRIIYIFTGIIITICLVGIIMVIGRKEQSFTKKGSIQSETIIDTHGNGSYFMGEYIYTNTSGIDDETHQYFVECIDYYEAESVVNTIPISFPEKARVETENRLELWLLRDICLNSEKEITGLFLHLLFEKQVDDGSWSECRDGKYWLYTYDENGVVLNSIQLDKKIRENEVETDAYYSTVMESKEGNFFILSEYFSGESQVLFELSPTGEVLNTRTFDEYTILCKTAGGYSILRTGNDIEILEEDCPYKKEVEKLNVDFVYTAYAGEEYEFTFWTNGIFYGVNAEGKENPIFEYESGDQIGLLEGKGIYRDGTLYGILPESGPDSNAARIIRISESCDEILVDEREIIYLASVYGLTESELFIRDFNRENKDYRIEIIPYFEEADPQKALVEDILTGKEIDIVDLAGIDYESLIEKDLLVNVYDFIEKDKELELQDFDEDILQAYERDGKLYEIVPAYYIGTLLTNSRQVTEYGDWNYDTMWKLAENAPDRCSDYELFIYSLMPNTELFLNKLNNSCDFDSEWFQGLLKKSAGLPSFNDATVHSVLEQVEARGFADCALGYKDICFLSAYNESQTSGIEISGLPGVEGGVHYIYAAQIYAITSTSDKTEIAWEVCRQLFTREYQLRLCQSSGAFATREDAMKELYETITATNAYEHDILGHIEPYSSNVAFGTPIENLTWGPAREEYIDLVEECKENSKVQAYEEKRMIDMIWEEAEPYFAGNGTVENTIDKIQNRVLIYLWE